MFQHPNIQRNRFRERSVNYAYVAATDYTTASVKIAPKSSKFCIWVQKIEVNVTTDNAAVQTFQSSDGTPVPIAVIKASPGIGPQVFEFGPEGYKLNAGKSLDHKMSAAGQAGAVTITAYEAPDDAQSLTPNIAGTTGDSF